ncbi:hypothetical protein HHK36_020732 [Tetracentron sinense]|uniref:Ubiquitin-like domain-containing protein n=1 Tax=Tetracentron sinense TaxID=13715 RepID=A0A834Z0C7_TETSI|nr:hypothetical protein HHK36_020732 [Tetracentron sinense]
MLKDRVYINPSFDVRVLHSVVQNIRSGNCRKTRVLCDAAASFSSFFRFPVLPGFSLSGFVYDVQKMLCRETVESYDDMKRLLDGIPLLIFDPNVLDILTHSRCFGRFTSRKRSIMAKEEECFELKFRVYDGTDIGHSSYASSITVATLKERLLAEWPQDKTVIPKSVNDVKIIYSGKVLENSKTLVESLIPFGDLPSGVITMHLVVQPPQDRNKTDVNRLVFDFSIRPRLRTWYASMRHGPRHPTPSEFSLFWTERYHAAGRNLSGRGVQYLLPDASFLVVSCIRNRIERSCINYYYTKRGIRNLSIHNLFLQGSYFQNLL